MSWRSLFILGIIFILSQTFSLRERKYNKMFANFGKKKFPVKKDGEKKRRKMLRSIGCSYLFRQMFFLALAPHLFRLFHLANCLFKLILGDFVVWLLFKMNPIETFAEYFGTIYDLQCANSRMQYIFTCTQHLHFCLRSIFSSSEWILSNLTIRIMHFWCDQNTLLETFCWMHLLQQNQQYVNNIENERAWNDWKLQKREE